jgi:hypothetical protein
VVHVIHIIEQFCVERPGVKTARMSGFSMALEMMGVPAYVFPWSSESTNFAAERYASRVPSPDGIWQGRRCVGQRMAPRPVAGAAP